MTTEERTRKIEHYSDAYNILTNALGHCPREMWRYKPSDSDWSIHEMVVHIADSEANSFVRCRIALAEPGKKVMAYDEVLWAKALRYHDQSTDDALDLFRALRRNTYKLISALPEHAWANTIDHPENGIMTLDDWLDVYARHISDHVAQMQANYEAWQQREKD